MEFIETRLKGAFLVELKRIEDHRGFFARALVPGRVRASTD